MYKVSSVISVAIEPFLVSAGVGASGWPERRMRIFLGLKVAPALLHEGAENLPVTHLFLSYCQASLLIDQIRCEFRGRERVSDSLKVTQFVLAKPELDRTSWLPK